MKYLVQDNIIVGYAENSIDGLPEGFSVFESDLLNILGDFVIDGEVIEKDPLPAQVSLVNQSTTQAFTETSLYKVARIRANKDPLLAFQVNLALFADLKGDMTSLAIAKNSIKCILRKYHGYTE